MGNSKCCPFFLITGRAAISNRILVIHCNILRDYNIFKNTKIILNIPNIMKYIVLILQIFLFASAQGQVSHFSINGRINYTYKSILNKIDQSSGFSIQTINDTMSIRKELMIIRKQQKTFTPKIGYDASGNIYFKVFNRLSVKTGLGINYLSFKLESKTLDFETVTLSSDTIKTKKDDITIIFTACDSFKNSFSDVGIAKPGRTLDVFHLKIPLELEYEVLQNKMYVRAGAYMQTPLFSAAKREYITTRSETVNGRKICEWVKVNEKNTSGTNLNNFQMGIAFEIAYRIFPNLSIEVGISKDLGNIFTKEEFQVYPAGGEDYRPLVMSFGIGYAFGNMKDDTQAGLSE